MFDVAHGNAIEMIDIKKEFEYLFSQQETWKGNRESKINREKEESQLNIFLLSLHPKEDNKASKT